MIDRNSGFLLVIALIVSIPFLIGPMTEKALEDKVRSDGAAREQITETQPETPPKLTERRRARDAATHQPQIELPPPANYEIVYLGSEACPACTAWKAEEYRAWRKDPARRYVRVRQAEIERFTINRGVHGENFGRYHRLYERAFPGERFSFPSFVLLDGREIVMAGPGARTWRRMEQVVRREAERAEMRRTLRQERARAG